MSRLLQSSGANGGGNTMPASVRSVVNSGGQPLDAATREFMEERFGHDLGDVRLHTDARAAESARDVHALAYTVGQDVVLGASSDGPTSQRGRVLLAHELAHTIQQRNGTGAPPSADPHGAVESTATAAARTVGSGGRVSGGLPASGVGLSCAPVPLDQLPEETLQEDLARVTEKLKQPAYEGRELDLLHQARLLATLQVKSKAREPAPPPPPPPAPPPPDPAAERKTAEKEALDLLERLKAEEEADKKVAEEEKRVEAEKDAVATERRLHPSLMSVTTDQACGGRCVTDDEIYGDTKKANERIDAQIDRERAAVGRRSFKQRLDAVRQRLMDKSEHRTRMVKESYITADQVWQEGFPSDFTEREKQAVYEAQGERLKEVQEHFDDERKRGITKAQIARDDAVKAGMAGIRSPAMFVQPFAYAALGPLIGAAYAGSQTGLLVGETYNACKEGLTTNCGVAVAQDAAAVTLHLATKGKPQTQRSTGGPGALTTRRAITGRPTVAEPDFIITEKPTLDASTGKVRASMIERASGRTLDAEIDPKTGYGQIVDRKTRQVVGEFRDGQAVPPTKNALPAGSTEPPVASNAPPVNKPAPPALTGSTDTNAPPALTDATAGTGATAGTSRISGAAYARLAEAQQILARVRERVAAAQAQLKQAEGNAQVARDLNKGAKRGSTNKDTAKGWLGEEEKALKAARSELAAAQKLEASVTGEVEHVARTQTKIANAELDLAKVRRRMTELDSDPARVAQGKTPNVGLSKSEPGGIEYDSLKKQKAQLEQTLQDLKGDLTRNVRDQVAGWSPGKAGRKPALESAQEVSKTVPELAPVGSMPIDVTTGRLMTTDAWETDHIISKNTIATDPRFLLLDPAGRNTMINGIPENYLPMTKAANGMKGDMTVNEFIMYRERIGEPIPSRMADGLRAAHARAAKAVDAMWDTLLKGK